MRAFASVRKHRHAPINSEEAENGEHMASLLQNQLKEKNQTCLLVFSLLREHLNVFAKHLPPLLEAQTASFLGTVH